MVTNLAWFLVVRIQQTYPTFDGLLCAEELLEVFVDVQVVDGKSLGLQLRDAVHHNLNPLRLGRVLSVECLKLNPERVIPANDHLESVKLNPECVIPANDHLGLRKSETQILNA